jgi:Na+/proline symporter
LIFSTAYWPPIISLRSPKSPRQPFPGSLFAVDILIIVTVWSFLLFFYGWTLAVCVTDVVQFLIFIAVCVVLIPVIFLSVDVGSITDFIRRFLH